MEEVDNPGRGPRGAGHFNHFTEASQAPVNPAHSGSGSSDDPDDRTDDLNEAETVQHPSRMARVSTFAGGQSSDGRRSNSGGSSSQKRKSVENSEESGKVKQSRLRPRDQIMDNMVQVGKNMITTYSEMRGNNYATMRNNSMDQCCTKMKDLKIRGIARNFCLQQFESDMVRSFFLTSSEEEIQDWFKSYRVPYDSPDSQPRASNDMPENVNPHTSSNPQTAFNPHAAFSNFTPNIPPAPYNFYQASNHQFFTDFLRMYDPNPSGPMPGFRPDAPPQ